MSTENSPVTKDEDRNSGSRKPQPEQGLNCPRCDSVNTKFCYYNNYSLSQPRHFCKTCRRYWTKGGALRSVPIGGGCRKNKKSRSSSSRLSDNSNNSRGSTSDIGSFKLFQGFSPAMDFQLDGASNFPILNNTQFSNTTSYFGFDTLGNSSLSSPLMGFDFSMPNMIKQGESSGYVLEGIDNELGTSVNAHSNIASMESLSSINQDLHWKLQQQQRLGMLFYGEEINHKENPNLYLPIESINVPKPQPIMFHNLEISKKNDCGVDGISRKEGGSGGDIETEWFFESSYAPMNNQNSTNNSNDGNDGISNWSGIQGWSDLNHYGALP